MADTKTAPAATEKKDRDFNVTVRDGAGARMEVRAKHLKDGRWTTFLRHVKKGSEGNEIQVGEREFHTSLDEARGRVTKAVAELKGEGWRGGNGGGFVRTRADSFDKGSRPKPGAAVAKPDATLAEKVAAREAGTTTGKAAQVAGKK